LRLAFVAALEQRGLSGTLSVGVGIGHLLESMGDLLGLGRKAEKLAKRERNSLGVIFDKRSGGTLEWSAGWALEPLSLLTLPDGLSTKKLYQLKSDLGRMPAPDASRTTWAGVLRADTERTLDRSGDKALTPADARLVWPADPLDYPAHHAALTEWVARMLIARNLAEHTVATANGEGNP
jgi:CRISPR-associated protein Cmr2